MHPCVQASSRFLARFDSRSVDGWLVKIQGSKARRFWRTYPLAMMEGRLDIYSMQRLGFLRPNLGTDRRTEAPCRIAQALNHAMQWGDLLHSTCKTVQGICMQPCMHVPCLGRKKSSYAFWGRKQPSISCWNVCSPGTLCARYGRRVMRCGGSSCRAGARLMGVMKVRGVQDRRVTVVMEKSVKSCHGCYLLLKMTRKCIDDSFF